MTKYYSSENVFDTDKDILLHDTGRRPCGDGDGQLGEVQELWYMTKNNKFYKISHAWYFESQGFWEGLFSPTNRKFKPVDTIFVLIDTYTITYMMNHRFTKSTVEMLEKKLFTNK